MRFSKSKPALEPYFSEGPSQPKGQHMVTATTQTLPHCSARPTRPPQFDRSRNQRHANQLALHIVRIPKIVHLQLTHDGVVKVNSVCVCVVVLGFLFPPSNPFGFARLPLLGRLQLLLRHTRRKRLHKKQLTFHYALHPTPLQLQCRPIRTIAMLHDRIIVLFCIYCIYIIYLSFHFSREVAWANRFFSRLLLNFRLEVSGE